MKQQITVNRPFSNRNFGWGYNTKPASDGFYVEATEKPDYRGTLKQLCNTAGHVAEEMGSSYYSQAWFYNGWRIVEVKGWFNPGNTDAMLGWLNNADYEREMGRTVDSVTLIVDVPDAARPAFERFQAATALRSIPSDKRTAASKTNGAKGGRPRKPAAE